MSIVSYGIDTVELTLLGDIQKQMLYCESLRQKAYYKTGSISEASAVYLRILCDQFKPKTIIEIGTFIGTSTKAMASSKSVFEIFTCDLHNDCLPSDDQIHCHPQQGSTTMLSKLLGKVKADLFFFDGRIQGVDLAPILRLSNPFAMYLFDDYESNEKGVVNVEMLKPYLKDYTLIAPPLKVGNLDTASTIAILMPKELV